MENYKKIFSVVTISAIVISLIGAVVVRNSVWKFEYSDVLERASQMLYYPYPQEDTSNANFIEVSSSTNLEDESQYIIKGKATGKREVLTETVLTEIEVIEVIKGNIQEKIISIYEPIGISYNTLSSNNGYNFIKSDKEYILCFKDSKYTDNYLYVSSFCAKFPLEYKEEEFAIINEDIFAEPNIFYENYKNYEQIFKSEEKKNIYFEQYNKLISKYK